MKLIKVQFIGNNVSLVCEGTVKQVEDQLNTEKPLVKLKIHNGGLVHVNPDTIAFVQNYRELTASGSHVVDPSGRLRPVR